MVLSQPFLDILSTRGVFSRVENMYDYVKDNPGTSFVYDTEYIKLFRILSNFNEYDVCLVIVTVIVLAGLFTREYKTGFICILNATKNGGVKTAKNKVLVSILVCTILYILSIIPQILEIYYMYDFQNLSQSIVSLEVFHNLPVGISILGYFILFYLVRYVSYILVILIVDYISLKFKNFVFSFIASFCVLLMPFVLSVLKVVKIEIFPFMNLSIISDNLGYILFVPVIVFISIFLYNSVVNGLE